MLDCELVLQEIEELMTSIEAEVEEWDDNACYSFPEQWGALMQAQKYAKLTKSMIEEFCNLV